MDFTLGREIKFKQINRALDTRARKCYNGSNKNVALP